MVVFFAEIHVFLTFNMIYPLIIKKKTQLLSTLDAIVTHRKSAYQQINLFIIDKSQEEEEEEDNK